MPGPQKTNLEPDIDLEDEEEEPNLPAPVEEIAPALDAAQIAAAASGAEVIVRYAKLAPAAPGVYRMIDATATIEFVSTATETEALLLEANLIKRLRPRFNVLLRDDKSFPYILIGSDHPAPQIRKHRGARNRAGSYFGP